MTLKWHAYTDTVQKPQNSHFDWIDGLITGKVKNMVLIFVNKMRSASLHFNWQRLNASMLQGAIFRFSKKASEKYTIFSFLLSFTKKKT